MLRHNHPVHPGLDAIAAALDLMGCKFAINDTAEPADVPDIATGVLAATCDAMHLSRLAEADDEDGMRDVHDAHVCGYLGAIAHMQEGDPHKTYAAILATSGHLIHTARDMLNNARSLASAIRDGHRDSIGEAAWLLDGSLRCLGQAMDQVKVDVAEADTAADSPADA